MEKRINEVEFDEFEKLLGEIPDVTSGPALSLKCPTKETIGTNLTKNMRLDEDKSPRVDSGVHYEESKLPDDQSLTSAFADLSFNETSSSQFIYGQYLHELPSDLDYPVSLGPSFGTHNSIMRVDTELGVLGNSGSFPRGVQGFQFVPNVPSVQGIKYPLYQDHHHQQQQCYLHSQRLTHPQMTWGPMEDDQYYRLLQQYMRMQHLRSSHHPFQANGNVTPHLMSQNYRLFNQQAIIDYNRLWKKDFSEKVLPESLGHDPLRNDLLREVNQNGRVFSNNHYHRISPNSYGDLKCNNLRPLMQKFSFNSIDDVAGKIYLLARDQNGCRFLQRKFIEGTQKDIDMIFSEIIMHVVELMTDPFGNYLVQKLLEVCNEDQQMQILRTITRKPADLIRISCDMHGTRAVQKIIETLRTPEQFSLIVSSLKPGIVPLMKNINGNHVAQRCLQYLVPEYNEFLFEAAFTSCVELATDRHGCCVLQKCLTHCDGDKRHRLMCGIISNALILSQDQYGNYVVQFVLKMQISWATRDVLEQLEGNYGDLSMQKYSSNVIEKCLKHAKEEQQSRVIKELIGDCRFDQILQDPYGNYVIQAALKHSKGTFHGALVEAIRPHVPLLRTSPYGKKVLQGIA